MIAIEPAGKNKYNRQLWRCKCDCGNEKVATWDGLRDGTTKSCGCLHRKTSAENSRKSRDSVTKHSGSHEKLYYVWRSMRSRCTSPNNPRYKDWGGRGISVCKEWADDYAVFRAWAFQHGYNPNAERGQCTIERIDNNGDYCPEQKTCKTSIFVNPRKRRKTNDLIWKRNPAAHVQGGYHH